MTCNSSCTKAVIGVSNFYANISESKCNPCMSNCLECTTSIDCQLCNITSSYYLSLSQNSCERCLERCSTCSNSAMACTSCSAKIPYCSDCNTVNATDKSC